MSDDLDFTGSTASGALTRFTDLERQFPDRFVVNIDSGFTGDDFSVSGYDTLTGLAISSYVSADGNINFTATYDPSEQILPDYPSMQYIDPSQSLFPPLTSFESGFGNSFSLGSFSPSFGNNYSFTSGLNLTSGFTLGVVGSTSGILGGDYKNNLKLV
jgi:hypothetical protein